MNKAIIEALKTGSLKRVILFGNSDKMPAAPYVVVKPEPGVSNGRVNFRIIVHVKQGYQDKLNDYIFQELSGILSNKQITDEKGNKFTVISTNEWTGPIGMNDDHTISMERIFFIPYRLR
jgi:hypothetical protein